MTPRARILVIAATERELAPADGWMTVRCGVGPVEAAAATARAIVTLTPTAILHVGVAGARRSRGLAPASFVIGSEALYCDLSVPTSLAPHIASPDRRLVMAAERVLPDAQTMVIGTSGRVGGSAACDVEAMEGFGVLRAAEVAGIPALEVRAISNDIEESDRGRWHLDLAFAAIQRVTPSLVEEVARCVS